MPFANGNASMECLIFACEGNENQIVLLGEYSEESMTELNQNVLSRLRRTICRVEHLLFVALTLLFL